MRWAARALLLNRWDGSTIGLNVTLESFLPLLPGRRFRW